MHMVFLSRGFKNLQWYSMTKRMISYEIILFLFMCEIFANGDQTSYSAGWQMCSSSSRSKE